jgi:DNA-binding SARP family transcriptional activator
MGEGELRIGILGPLDVRIRDTSAPLGPFKQRIVLGLLSACPNAVVPVDTFLDALWPDQMPRTARKNLHVYVSTLRKLVSRDDGPSRIRHEGPGYRLRVRPDELDALQFRQLARTSRLARREGDPSAAAAAAASALRLWRGPALADVPQGQTISEAAERLEEERLAVHEEWLEAELDLGRHSLVLDVIADLVRDHPLRERLRSAQLLALYRSGRQADAVAEFDRVRQLLSTELGLQPSPALARLYQSILAGETSPCIAPAPRVTLTRPLSSASQLTHDVGDFTGRQEAIRNLRTVLACPASAGTVAGISGGAGSGKTALAVHVGHLLRHGFDGGQLLVRLCSPSGRPRPAAEVLTEIVSRLTPGTPRPKLADERAALYRALLVERRLLIILDHAIDEAQVSPLLPRAGHSCVLVTSRRALRGIPAAVRVETGSFTADEALAFLSKIAGRDRMAGSDADVVAEVIRACGLLPLALRIAGARLAAAQHMTMRQLARRLTDQRRVLDELSIGDLSLRECAASYVDALQPWERATVARLARTPCASFPAAAFTSSPGLFPGGPDPDGVLDRFLRAGLAGSGPAGSRPAQQRYWLCGWLRAYARDLLVVKDPGRPAPALAESGTAARQRALRRTASADATSGLGQARRERFTADRTARIEALAVFVSMPTPQ